MAGVCLIHGPFLNDACPVCVTSAGTITPAHGVPLDTHHWLYKSGYSQGWLDAIASTTATERMLERE